MRDTRFSKIRTLTAALFLAVGGLAAAAAPCPEGDLLPAAALRAEKVLGDPSVVVDGQLLVEGSAIDPSGAVILDGAGALLEFDLGALRPVTALALQADHDDAYVVDGSADGTRWNRLWTAPGSPGTGLRLRAALSPEPAPVRFLRLAGVEGDGVYAVSEFRVYCHRPDPWPPRPEAAVPGPPPAVVGRARVEALKLGLALAGLLLFAAGALLERMGRPEAGRRVRDGLLLALGLTAGLCWWNLGRFHFGSYVHVWDTYHYYVGAKYFTELGHTGLYECTSVADVEAGLGERVRQRRIRDAGTNRLTGTAALVADPDLCKARFSPQRWGEFRDDVAWFREHIHPDLWERVFADHGYNPTPVWGIAGRLLTGLTRASDAGLLALTLIDPLLLVVMWSLVVWAFGWRVACVGLLWWGTNDLAPFSWTGGGLLRQDWLVLTVAGVCLLRRARPGAAGFALGYAALLRVFPGFLIGGLVLSVLVSSWWARRLRLSPAQLRFAGGVLAATAILVPLSLAMSGGTGAWVAFGENTRANLRSAGTNTVGLMTALTYEHDLRFEKLRDATLEDPASGWLEAKRELFRDRRPLFWILALVFLVYLARAVAGRPDWVALSLATGLIPVLSFVACYYYSVLVAYSLLAARRFNTTGLLLTALAATTQLAHRLWPDPIHLDRRFAYNSAATVLVVVLTTVLWGRSGSRNRELPAGSPTG